MAGLTFLALGNGAPDIFSMVAAAIASPHGVEMSLGEVCSNILCLFASISLIWGDSFP